MNLREELIQKGLIKPRGGRHTKRSYVPPDSIRIANLKEAYINLMRGPEALTKEEAIELIGKSHLYGFLRGWVGSLKSRKKES